MSSFSGATKRRSTHGLRSIAVIAALALMAGVLFTPSAQAAPAAPRTFELRQPDGSRFEARLYGDEWNHGYETARGFTILKDRSGVWRYATSTADGTLAPGPRSATESPAGAPKHLRPEQRERSPQAEGADQASMVESRPQSERDLTRDRAGAGDPGAVHQPDLRSARLRPSGTTSSSARVTALPSTTTRPRTASTTSSRRGVERHRQRRDRGLGDSRHGAPEQR